LHLPGLAFYFFDLPERTAIVDLALSMEAKDGVLIGSVEFNRDRFDQATAARLLGQLSTLLGAIGSAAELAQREIGDLPLLTAAERHQLLHEWQGAPLPPAGRPGLHHLFEAQAALTPHAVAL